LDKVNNQGIVLLWFGVLDMPKFGLVGWIWFVWLAVLIGTVLHPFLFSMAVWDGLIRFGLVKYNMARFGWIKYGAVWFG
jgi:hypothetical protein